MTPIVKSQREIESMAKAGRIVAECLALIRDAIRPGLATDHFDKLAEKFILSHPGASPSFKGLYGFPASICTSINDEIVHGIPSKKRTIRDGDLLSVDVGVKVDEHHADSAATFPVGDVSEEASKLLKVTMDALAAGVQQAIEGNYTGDIGNAVQRVVQAADFSVVRELVGHGIGIDFHEEPQVPNYGRPRKGCRLVADMTIAIEPMVNAGAPDIRTLPDKWTVVTIDGKLSAHFEHTVVVGRPGSLPRILTRTDSD